MCVCVYERVRTCMNSSGMDGADGCGFRTSRCSSAVMLWLHDLAPGRCGGCSTLPGENQGSNTPTRAHHPLVGWARCIPLFQDLIERPPDRTP